MAFSWVSKKTPATLNNGQKGPFGWQVNPAGGPGYLGYPGTSPTRLSKYNPTDFAQASRSRGSGSGDFAQSSATGLMYDADALTGGASGGGKSFADAKAAFDRGETSFEKLMEVYNLESRNPAVTDATTKTMEAASAGIDFNKIKADFAGAKSEMDTRYKDFQSGNDNTNYNARIEKELADAKSSLERYRTEGKGALDTYQQNAQDYLNKDIPRMQQYIVDSGMAGTNRFAQGQGGGANSAMAQYFSQATTPGVLSAQERGRGMVGETLSRYQPFHGDVAGRDFNRISGLDVPAINQMKNLELLVKQRGLDGARQNLVDQGLPENTINQMLSQYMNTIGKAADIEQQYGAASGYNYLPGGNVQSPQYFGMPQPDFPQNTPGRYGNPDTNYASGGKATGNPNQANIDRVMEYSNKNPASNPYGGPGGVGKPNSLPGPGYDAMFKDLGQGRWDMPLDYNNGRDYTQQLDYYKQQAQGEGYTPYSNYGPEYDKQMAYWARG